MFPTILCMLDCSENDETLVEALVTNAGQLGAERVVVAHVRNRDPVAPGMADLIGAEDQTIPPELQLAAERLEAALDGVTVETAYRQGTPEVELASLGTDHDADLVVLGRPPAVGGKAGWGSSGSKLVRLTPCSVLVLPRGCTLDLSKAVVGLDFSKHALLGLRTACRLTGNVTAVFHFRTPRSHKAGLNSQQLAEKVMTRSQKLLDEQVTELELACGPELKVVGTGKVGEALIDAAGFGLLVVGSRGITTMAWVLLGSNASRVAGRALGPALIVRDKHDGPKGVLERLAGR